jgi:hypothetical protein
LQKTAAHSTHPSRFYGFTWLQVYLYYTQHSSRDRMFLKCFVSHHEQKYFWLPIRVKATGCGTHVGRHAPLEEAHRTHVHQIQRFRFITPGTSLPWVVCRSYHEFRKSSGGPSCPMVSMSYLWISQAHGLILPQEFSGMATCSRI